MLEIFASWKIFRQGWKFSNMSKISKIVEFSNVAENVAFVEYFGAKWHISPDLRVHSDDHDEWSRWAHDIVIDPGDTAVLSETTGWPRRACVLRSSFQQPLGGLGGQRIVTSPYCWVVPTRTWLWWTIVRVIKGWTRTLRVMAHTTSLHACTRCYSTPLCFSTPPLCGSLDIYQWYMFAVHQN